MYTQHQIRRKLVTTFYFSKALIWGLIYVLSFLAFYVDDLQSQVHVRGYRRKNGTYVRPHERTRPDGNPYNNYSFPGNYNPNTRQITPGNPETCLRNYYNRHRSDSPSSSTDNPIITNSTGIPERSDAKNRVYITRQEFEKRYREALNLYERYKYSEAVNLFSTLLEEDTHGKLADNSQYWIGECYFGLADYQHSITEFEKVFKFSDEDKYDDAYLKLGLCYLRIGNQQDAKKNFNQILDSFPQSEYAEKAMYYLDKID